LSFSTISLCVRPWQVHARIADVDAGKILSSITFGLKLSLNAGSEDVHWNSMDDVGVDVESRSSSWNRMKLIVVEYRSLL
jgi:hypothetical protein